MHISRWPTIMPIDFMSCDPRAKMRPRSSISAPNGGRLHSAASAGTTSTWLHLFCIFCLVVFVLVSNFVFVLLFGKPDAMTKIKLENFSLEREKGEGCAPVEQKR